MIHQKIQIFTFKCIAKGFLFIDTLTQLISCFQKQYKFFIDKNNIK